VGLISKEGLQVIADIWRAEKIESEMSWHDLESLNQKTIHEAHSRHITNDSDEESRANVISQWTFPLYGLDLSEKKIDSRTLREKQAMWLPDS
jgi:hypothetical protein